VANGRQILLKQPTHDGVKMAHVTNPEFAEFQKTNAEVLHTILLIAFKGIERLSALNNAAGQEYLSLNNQSEGSGSKTPTKPDLNHWLEYANDINILIWQMQKEILTVMDEQYYRHLGAADVKHRVSSNRYHDTMESMLESTTQAFELMVRSAKQLSELTVANIQSTRFS